MQTHVYLVTTFKSFMTIIDPLMSTVLIQKMPQKCKTVDVAVKYQQKDEVVLSMLFSLRIKSSFTR